MAMGPLVEFALQALTLTLTIINQVKAADENGFDLMFESQPQEMTDVPMTFTNPLPDWMKGTLVRNGPGQLENGNRKVLHIFDAFAKMSSWKFVNNTSALFSTKFIRSDFYKTSMKTGTIAPTMMFDGVEPPFSFFEKMGAFMSGMDNMNINILKFMNSQTKTAEYAALSDAYSVQKVDIERLDTMEKITPKTLKWGYMNVLSSAHPVPEPGTDNHLTFVYLNPTLPWSKTRLSLVRITSLKGREVIAEWPVDRLAYMHSLSVTGTKAVILANPLIIDMTCALWNGAPFDCLNWEPDQPGIIYLVDLKTGHVSEVAMTEASLTLHHVNAYDVTDTSLIMDICAYADASTLTFLQVENIMNHDTRNSMSVHGKVKRLKVDLSDSGSVTEIPIDHDPSSPSVASLLEMPVINELYRSKEYCYVYGLIWKADNVTLSNMAIVKKDLCNQGAGDLVWHVDNHYPVEPWFVATPGGTEEDDGLLLVPMVDGVREISYLAVLNATTFAVESQADMPSVIAYTLHGRLFV